MSINSITKDKENITKKSPDFNPTTASPLNETVNSPASITAMPPSAGINSQVAMLKQMDTVGQQAMVNRIGHRQGNQHVMRLMSAMRPNRASKNTPAIQAKSISENEDGEAMLSPEQALATEQAAQQNQQANGAEDGPPTPPNPQDNPSATLSATPSQFQPPQRQIIPAHSAQPNTDLNAHVQTNPVAIPELLPNTDLVPPLDLPTINITDPIYPLFDSLQGTAPTDLADIAAQAKADLPAVQAEEQQALAPAFPSQLRLPLGIPTLGEAVGREEHDQAEKQANIDAMVESEALEDESLNAESEGDTEQYRLEREAFNQNIDQSNKEVDQSQREQMPNQAKTQSGVSTSAGPRPMVDLSGERDPANIVRQEEQLNQQVGQRFNQTEQALQADYGETEIYPDIESEALPPVGPIQLPKPSEAKAAFSILGDLGNITEQRLAEAEEQAEEQAQASMPLPVQRQAEMQQAAPQAASTEAIEQEMETMATAGISQMQNLHQQNYGERQSELEQQLADSQQQLTAYSELGQMQLETIQQETQQEIASQKQAWQSQNQATLQTYQQQAQALRQQGQTELEQLVTTGEQEAHDLLSKAEAKAESTKSSAEGKAGGVMDKARSKAAGRLGGVGVSMDGSYESQAVQSNAVIMRAVDAGGASGGDDSDREAEIQQAKDDAQNTVDNAVAEAERILKEMEDKVAKILADAQLDAEQKKLQVEQAVKDALEQINQMQQTESENACRVVDDDALDQSMQIFQKITNSIANVNNMVYQFEQDELQKQQVIPFHYNPEDYYLTQTQTIDELPDSYVPVDLAQDVVDAIVPESGTVGFSIIGGAGIGAEVTASFDVFIDDDGDLALGFTLGGGGTTGINLSAGVAATRTNADDVEKLAGGGMNAGGSVVVGVGSVGADYVGTKDSETGEPIHGVSVYATAGPDIPFPVMPAEIHAHGTYTWQTPKVNLYDMLGFERPNRSEDEISE